MASASGRADPCHGKRNVAQTAARQDSVEPRLEVGRRTGPRDGVTMHREQPAPVRVMPVHANALRLQQGHALVDQFANRRRSSMASARSLTMPPIDSEAAPCPYSYAPARDMETR